LFENFVALRRRGVHAICQALARFGAHARPKRVADAPLAADKLASRGSSLRHVQRARCAPRARARARFVSAARRCCNAYSATPCRARARAAPLTGWC